MFSRKLSASLVLLVLVGCRSGGYRESAYYQDSDYGLMPDAQAGVPPSEEKSFVDRHPLFSAPRNYYRDSGDNRVVKVLAGTFIGVPVGVAQEIWQIGYGQ